VPPAPSADEDGGAPWALWAALGAVIVLAGGGAMILRRRRGAPTAP
jgi:LPXTG-motif cell wall-anchored protein